MPFKSEKQRKYLWANEPEIARDWTDTYGSKIHKADGGRIGFKDGSDYEQFSRAVSRTANNPTRSSVPDRGGDHGQFQRRIDHTAANKQMAEREAKERNIIQKSMDSGISYLKNAQKKSILKSADRNKVLAMRKMGLRKGWNPFSDEEDWSKNLSDADLREMAFDVQGIKDYGQATYNYNLNPSKRGSGSELLGRVSELKSDPTQANYNRLFPGPDLGTGGEGGGLPYIYPYETASAPIEEEEIETVSTDPINRYAGSYRVRPEYLIAEGGRVPAAYGGIMDTYTGRRKYGFGSFLSKPFKAAKKAVKKLASSPIGKLAMLYAAGTYLGGTQALSGKFGGAGTFAERLKNPKLLANLIKTDQWGTAIDPRVDKGFHKALQNKKLIDRIPGGAVTAIGLPSVIAGGLTAQQPVEDFESVQGDYDDELARWEEILAPYKGKYRVQDEYLVAEGGRIGKQEGGIMDLGGMEKDYRNDGGFVPIGGEEKADDVPARLSRNEFVFTADAVRSAGGGDIDKGAEVMENVMKNLEQGGTVSEESQGKGGAQGMFEVSERLSEVM